MPGRTQLFELTEQLQYNDDGIIQLKEAESAGRRRVRVLTSDATASQTVRVTRVPNDGWTGTYPGWKK